MIPTRRARSVVPALVLLLPFVTVGSGSAAPSSQIRSVASPDAAGKSTTVTLITGDKVSLSKGADGKPATFIQPGQGREKIAFFARLREGHVEVVPSDAGPLLNAGRLDRRLFDVTQLVEFGYDDNKTDTLPLIVTGDRVGALNVSGARVRHQLPSVRGVALAEVKQDAPAFWRSLTAAAGVGKVWLSGKAKVFDERSNAQIGVPAARQAGYDGKGITIAVLDTGVDLTHPDLKDVVVETKDFTGTDVKDGVGHGTHVASIIAGTGANNATYGGVAPKATVIAGKVCGTEYCEEAAILAGMEWAAGRAKVVNMSLGSNRGTNDDLLAQAVNSLSAATGTLFVASAGNAYNAYQVASPSTADAALSVASVSRTDALSGFSSEGPRTGDHAVKPDIAAPGEAIVAARGAGTTLGTPVGDSYVAASGTSMSSPHVAGVAALLAQARPDWTGAELKAALMGSSTGDLPVFAVGAGRVDAARAVTQTVFADGSVSFPQATWPRSSEPVTKSVTYRNKGDSPVTLNLALSDATGVFTLSASTLTVPANGKAGVDVTLDPAKLPTGGGLASARVTATADGVSVRTAVGVAAEAESFDVQVTLLDRTGQPASDEFWQSVSLYHHTLDGEWWFDGDVVGGVAKFRLPKGDYAIFADTATPADAATGRPESATTEIRPSHPIDKNTEIVLDARKGARAKLGVADRPEAVEKALTLDTQAKFGERTVGTWSTVVRGAELYAVPAKAGSGQSLQLGLSAVLGSPAGEPKPYQYYVTKLGPENVFPDKPEFQVRTAELARRDVQFRAQGKPADAFVARAPFYMPGGYAFGAYSDVSLPSNRIEYMSAEPEHWVSVMSFQRPAGEPATAPFGEVTDNTGKVAVGMPVPEVWNGAVVGPSLALAPNFATQVYRSGDRLGAYIPMFTPSSNHGSNVGHQTITAKGDTTLALEGHEPVGSGYAGLASFAGLPDTEARYTLTASATRIDWVPWFEHTTKTEASWTFRSSPADDLLPLMYLRTNGPFDGLGKARSGAFPLRVDVARQPRSTPTTAKVKSVVVEYSTDDGATWKRAPVAGSGNSWFALVLNPRSGYVSLRTTVTDSAGDTHSTTVTRAYGIR